MVGDIIFQTIGNLTGGLVTDLTTLVIALLVLQFIVFGFDEIMYLIGDFISDPQKRRSALMKFKGGVGHLEMEKSKSGSIASTSDDDEDPETKYWWA